MNYIEPKAGVTYSPAHLRQAKSVEELLSLARQGHPLAWAINNCEVRYLAQNDADGRWFDFSHYEPNEQIWINRQRSVFELPVTVRLAPLAVKDGRPLHVGDVIEVKHREWSDFAQIGCTPERWSQIERQGHAWRWPVEV